jgi:hypothetical protein
MVEEDGEKFLLVKVPVNRSFQSSRSGTTRLVASSHGNAKTGVHVPFEGKSCEVVLGLNAYIKP